MRTFIFLTVILFVFQAAILPQTRVYPSTRAQIETPIAINPTNPNNFIGAAITLVWSAQAQEVGGNADIRMIKGSINSGQFSWNTNIINVDGSSGEQWMPAINVNPDGVLSILYYSSGSNLNDPIYTKFRYSKNGGNNFTTLNVGVQMDLLLWSSNWGILPDERDDLD